MSGPTGFLLDFLAFVEGWLTSHRLWAGACAAVVLTLWLLLRARGPLTLATVGRSVSFAVSSVAAVGAVVVLGAFYDSMASRPTEVIALVAYVVGMTYAVVFSARAWLGAGVSWVEEATSVPAAAVESEGTSHV